MIKKMRRLRKFYKRILNGIDGGWDVLCWFIISLIYIFDIIAWCDVFNII